MQREFVRALYQYLIDDLLIHLVPQGDGGEGLGFTPGENG